MDKAQPIMTEDKKPRSQGRREVAKLYGVRFKRNRYLNRRKIERIRSGLYEGPEIKAARKEITSDDRVLELGAGIGVVSSVVAVCCSPERMISFDANPHLVPIVNGNLQFNKVTNAECRHGIVVGGNSHPETKQFHVAGNYLGSSLSDRGKTKEVIDVPVVSYRDIQEELRPTALIVDIEGAELELFEEIDLRSIRVIICELHPDVYGDDGVDRIFRSFARSGFVYSTRSSTGAVVAFYNSCWKK